ncbi:unnamed protein product [Staurois parvus]|uniref:Uncharacterized protein n=1 Tax=Staurois parvus TaxID=386267 RepID=A0ABN9GBZ3_9NEOB|nr:unnamed protein product [Staurois parvus]
MQLFGHGNPFHEALYTLQIWRSLAIDSADSRRLPCTVRFSMRCPRSAILRGLTLHG